MRSLTFATLFCAMSCRADRQPGPAAAEPDWYRAVGADWPLPAAPGQAATPGPAFHHQPDARRSYAWAEHPTGALALRTNGQGFREDAETAPAPDPGRPRWVALGDSHTDGVAPNAETWPNRLEARLAAAGVDVEVINAGAGHYGPAELQAAAARLLRLRPAGLILAPYLGNDLLDGLVSEAAAGGPPVPAAPPRVPRLLRLVERWPGPVHQQLNQDLLLAEHPALAAPACAHLAGALQRAAAAATAAGVAVLVAPLPGALELAPPEDELLDAISDTLGLRAEQLHQHRPCAAGLEAAVRAGLPPGAALRWVDPGPALRAAGRPAVWAADLHLSVIGNDVMAGVIAESLLLMRPEGPPAGAGPSAAPPLPPPPAPPPLSVEP
jgi:hypothetical protein